MDSEPRKKKKQQQLHIFFVPHFANGHMTAILHTAKLLAAEHGARSTLVTTPGNAYIFNDTINDATRSGLSMQLLLLPFPDVGLPPGCESTASIPQTAENRFLLHKAGYLLREPFEGLLHEHLPDCIVGDAMSLWCADVAESFHIPYVQFNVSSPFAFCVLETVYSQAAHHNADASTDTIGPLTGLPHPLVLQRTELTLPAEYVDMYMGDLVRILRRSIGVIHNSFCELAPEYLDAIVKSGRIKRLWCVGPLQLSSTTISTNAPKNWEWIKKWLDTKEKESVVCVSFGTEWQFSHEQLRQLAIGLDSSGHSFVWILKGEDDTMAEWMPEGFYERVEGRGLVITEWAPQFMILNHPALGASICHCGWNSGIESVCAGLPVIAWPLHSEQFLNERFFVEALKIGVRIIEGDMREPKLKSEKVVSAEKVREAVMNILGSGEEVKEMRRKAKEYSKLAKMAMEKGGSSKLELSSLFEELTLIAQDKRNAAAAATS
uniref:Flavonol glycoside 1,4-rhamnosyltransferase n=1 Tax=Crocosmia x crocosmiiflora TaxID=1053288 RepID=A0A7H1JNH3_CROXC|nr:flavonol glycoside 1,4-rhamnosyltransferase [Crocosmia x crocosmiiflora]